MNHLQKKMSAMCWVYLIFSLSYYVALPLIIFLPILAPLGLQSPYHMFLLYLALGDGPAFPGRMLFLLLCIGGAIAMLIIFLIFLLAAFLKRNYRPLGWLMVVSNLITVATVVYILCAYSSMSAILLLALPGIIGNTIFIWLYFRTINKLKSEQNISIQGTKYTPENLS